MTNSTTDLSKFGYRELYMLSELINAMITQGLPDDFYDDEVVPMVNPYSGNVFLTNSEYQTAMIDADGNLKQFYWLGYHGYEGFLDDLLKQYDNGDIEQEDWEELAYICERNNLDAKADEIRQCLNNINEGE